MFQDVYTVLKGLVQRFFLPVLALCIGLYIAKSLGAQNISKATLPFAGIVAAVSLLCLFYYPRLMLFTAMAVGHFIAHLGRIGVTLPVGLSIDGLLALALIVLMIQGKKGTFEHLKKPEFIAIFIWIGYTLVQIANPISPGPVAWFYAMRSISLYYVLTPVVAVALIQTKRQLHFAINLLIPLSILLAVVSLRQHYSGMNEYEMRWLLSGPIRTHFLRGKMRVFSLLADASTFGAYAAYIATIFGVLAAYPGRLKGRFLFIILALLNFYAMMLSGSRGPLAIIGVGGMLYLIMSKKLGITIFGSAMGGGFFVFLKYTTILQGNYNVARLRSALDPNDASLLVRKAKEAMLSVYMANKPIGGGIGSAGMWGERFAPGSFLANTPTDGLYSRIWMETGIVGLYLYLGVFAVLTVYMGYRLWNLPNGLLKQKVVAMYCGFVGLLVASYVNELITQVPISIISYTTPALVILLHHWHKTGVDITDGPQEERPPL